MSEEIEVTADSGITAGIPEAAVWAGMAAWDSANHDLERYVPGVTTDWDEGMIVCAIHKAMLAATPSPDLKAEKAALVEKAIAEFDAADWTDCFPQGGACRDLLAAAYGLPQHFVEEGS